MITTDKTLRLFFTVCLTSLVLLSPSFILAEKQGHDEHKGHDHDEHNKKNQEDDHKGHDHNEHDKKNQEDDHKGHDHDEHDKKNQEDDHKGHDHDEHNKKNQEDDHKGHDKHGKNSQEDDHKGHDEHGHEEAPEDVKLTRKQMQQVGIQTLRLKRQSIHQTISALSEVKLNQYQTIQVSPTLTTRVEKRHVRLGDKVKKGDLLVTLHTITTSDISSNILSTADLAASSAELSANIAGAKGELAIATETWRRIRSLGRDAVSGKRYTEAKIAKEQAEAKLKAYGKSQSQVNRLLKSGSKAVQKHFELRAEQGGTIIKDDFVLGQVVTTDDVLFEISDMSTLWVEANIKANNVLQITKGAKASIQASDKSLQGKVIHIGRILNEKTRTLPVRIEVNNKNETLYAGQFVKTLISSKQKQSGIIVPTEAALRGSDGDWVVFVETSPRQFKPQEIDIVANRGDTLVIKGIKSGTTIVSKGAFAIQSEFAKSGFSVHNH